MRCDREGRGDPACTDRGGACQDGGVAAGERCVMVKKLNEYIAFVIIQLNFNIKIQR